MRKIIDSNISLHEKSHKYELKNSNIDFNSVTGIVGKYFKPFEKWKIAEKLSKTHKRYLGMSPSDIVIEWNNLRDHGTKVHDEIDKYLKKKSFPSEKKSFHALDWINKYKLKGSIKFYSEVIIFSKELKIAGSIDLLAFDESTQKFDIIDWKTSKSIDTKSYNTQKGTHNITSHLMDCKFVHYSMQLSFYRYILEKYYDIRVNNQIIAHLDGLKCSAIIGDYYRDEVKDIIKNERFEA